MANAVYEKARDAYLRQSTGYSWTDQDMRIMAVGIGYSPNIETDVSLASIPANTRVAAVALTGRNTNGRGAATASNAKFPALASDGEIKSFVVYRHTGTDSTSFLIAYIDTSPNLPYTPASTGNDLDVIFPNGIVYEV